MTGRPNAPEPAAGGPATSRRSSIRSLALALGLAPMVVASAGGGGLLAAPASFTEASGYAPVDSVAALERLLGTLPQTSSIFPAGGDLGPPTKAVLLLENEEGIARHARYRIRYGSQGVLAGPGGRVVPHGFVQIDRFDLGEAFREAVVQSVGEARTPPAEAFGGGGHVSYRVVFRPIQGRSADPIAMSRRAIAEDAAAAMSCLARPCLDLGGIGEGAMPWHDHAGSGIGFERPYEDVRNGVYTPASMADLLALETGAAAVHGGRLSWTGWEQPEGAQEGAQGVDFFAQIVMDVDLAQDHGVEAVMRLGGLMDDSVAAVWKRAVTFSGGGEAPFLVWWRAFECARGTPGPEGLCP